MKAAIEQGLYAGMKSEQDREGPPPGFPELPVIPGGRYTDPAFLALEERYLWKKSWLYALHVVGGVLRYGIPSFRLPRVIVPDAG